MPKFDRELIPNREVKWKYTLSELKRLLETTPETFGNREEEIRQAVEEAENELRETSKLSQRTGEELDNLFRHFK